MATLQRTLSLLRRTNGRYKIINIQPSSNTLMRPQYIAIRRYWNPDADHAELSETAWKEKRMYRYYKFSDQLSVTEQQRGYAAGLFVIAMLSIYTAFMWWIDIQTSFLYRHLRQTRDDVYYPFFDMAVEKGYWHPRGLCTDTKREMYDTVLPELRKDKGHDAPNKRAYKEAMCLDEVYKRDKEFDEPYFHGTYGMFIPTTVHPAYLKFLEENPKTE